MFYFILLYKFKKANMADTKQIMATIPTNLEKRINLQPEKVELKISTSRMIGILLNEALNAREAKSKVKRKS